MAIIKRNNSEGGSNGTAVTTGNSGGVSGDAWSAIGGTGSFVTYVLDTGVQGSLATLCNSGGGTANYVRWDFTNDEHWGRLFVRHTPVTGGSHAGPDMRVIEAYQSDNSTNICFVQFDINTGKWGVDNFFGLVETTTSYGAGSGRWMRVDWHFKLGSFASGGRTEARIYYDAVSHPNVYETIVSGGDTGTAGTMSILRIGLTNIPADARSVTIDNVQIGTGGWLRDTERTSRMGRVLSA